MKSLIMLNKYGFHPIDIAICHGCFRIIKRSTGNKRKCVHCGATHFSWLELKPIDVIEERRAAAELRIRADFDRAGINDAGRMAFVGATLPSDDHGQAAVTRP